ncbi:MAG: hypothetical protein QM757_41740 [Paludibaculum sp.]
MHFSFFRRTWMMAGKGQEGTSLRLPRLEYPLERPGRLGVLGLTVRQESGIHVFPEWTCADLNRFRPHALAGWRQDLVQAGRLRASGHLACELTYPLLVFSTPEQGPLDEAAHAELWNWFGVPAYEQIRTATGELVAVECETRTGFHTAGEDSANLILDSCNCGRGVRWDWRRIELPEPITAGEDTRPLVQAAGD